MKNWAGNIEFSGSSVARPATVAELAETVANSTKAKPLGTRHSFNTIADTMGTHIQLDALAGPAEIDSERSVVRVPGASSYGNLASMLESRGYALHNMASLPHISVAGAIQTGTHGSGIRNGGLSSAVRAIELVRASGAIDRLEDIDDHEFRGTVVGLGAMGIITNVELKIEPTFKIRQQVFDHLPWSTVLSEFTAIISDGYSLSLFTDFLGDTVAQVWRKVRITNEDTPRPDTFFGAPAANSPRHPIPDMSVVNCTSQQETPGPWLDRLPHFRHQMAPSRGEELQSEYLLPLRHAADALQVMRSLARRLAPLLYVSEIRSVAGDNLWLSPSYDQDSVAIHLTWRPLQDEVEALLPEIELRLAPFGARPHWGKLFSADSAYLADLYPQFSAFRDLANKRDPNGKFRNAFLDRTVFGR